MNKKPITNTVAVLLILIIPLIIYTLNFKLTLFDTDFYEKEFEKYGVYGRFGKDNVDEVNSRLLDYFSDGKKGNLIGNDFFGADEKQHLLDVKNVIQKASFLLGILIGSAVILLALLIYLFGFKELKNTAVVFILGGAGTIVLSLAIILLIHSNFDLPFTLMHRVLFEEGTWLFPAESNLIGIYPIGFFYDVARRLFFNTSIQGFILGFLASCCPYKRKVFKQQ